MWDGYQNGLVLLVCKRCSFGKVITLHDAGTKDPTPWDTWARALQLFGSTRGGWRVGFFAAPNKRDLTGATVVGPEHVNGGYAYPCQPQTIIVYRAEECTRVLLHELFHAACTDRRQELPHMESETESWAEWMLVALASDGDIALAKKLFAKQLQWVARLNKTLRAAPFAVSQPSDFAWRYTLGRENAYCRLGATVPVSHATPTTSSRLTHIDLEI